MRPERKPPPDMAISLCAVLLICALPLQGFCRQTEKVQCVDWPRYSAMMGIRSNDSFGQTLATVLQNEARYQLRWVATQQSLVTNVPGWEGLACYAPRFDAYNYECAVRPMTGFAYGMAALLKTGIYSDVGARLSRTDALHRTELAIRGQRGRSGGVCEPPDRFPGYFGRPPAHHGAPSNGLTPDAAADSRRGRLGQGRGSDGEVSYRNG